MSKFVRTSLITLIGFLLGAGLGGYFTFKVYSERYAVIRAFAWAELGLAVSEHEFNSNSNGASSALRNTLGLFDSGVQSSKVDPALRNALRMNVGRLNAQLSVLDKEAGNAEQARLDMLEAQKELISVGWIDSSETNVLRTFQRQAASPCGDSLQSATQQTAAKKPCG
jgi:hypothetical protein